MDFQQGLITTIHEYGINNDSLMDLNKKLKTKSTAILIPCLFDEFNRPAIKNIKDTLKNLTGINEIIIALSAKSKEEVIRVREFFKSMPFNVKVHWTNSPEVIELLKDQEKNGLDLIGTPGKGWAVWQGLGIASLDSEIIALFDADIKTFKDSYPIRMIYPLLDQSHGISYVKAFYSRVSLETKSLQGRATRLFVGPLLASIKELYGNGQFLEYLQAFRYPLAGEFAFNRELALNLRIPCDWGLEIGLLSEVYRNVRTSRIAQVDLGVFDHKHKEIGSSPKEGLMKMCSEILSSVLRGLMEHQGQTLSNSQISTLEVLYKKIGDDRVMQFGLDSLVNNLPYNRHQEQLAIQSFCKILRPTILSYLDNPIKQQLPCWARVNSCVNHLQDDLFRAGYK